jgi:phage terminase large subunit GpA-like protein
MSGGGGDKSRAGYTSRVVAITETDGMDQPGATSRESDKITQLEARTRAYGPRKRIYMECTVSTERGRTWQEYLHGTRSRIMLHCPACRAWVAPEREHLVGWQEADSQVAARTGGAFACPACGECWTHDQRCEANRNARLVHGEQALAADGAVQGDPPATDTLGFRWSAAHNLFLPSGEIAADEWRGAGRGRRPPSKAWNIQSGTSASPFGPRRLHGKTGLRTLAATQRKRTLGPLAPETLNGHHSNSAIGSPKGRIGIGRPL